MMASLRWIFGGLLILALAVVVAPVQANASYDITATLTADNDFILYYRQRRRHRPHTRWGHRQ